MKKCNTAGRESAAATARRAITRHSDWLRAGLAAERRDRGFNNRRDQKDKHKVGGGTAGRTVFLKLGHGSSQGCWNWEALPFPQIHGPGLYTVFGLRQALRNLPHHP